jgi:hypothetical protein
MRYTDTELRVWDGRRLRIGRERRDAYLAQVSTLISKLESAIPAGSPFKVVRCRRAGSLMKATGLLPRGDNGIDADIAVYLDASGASDWDLTTLHATLREIAIGVYPTKSPEDFWPQEHTMGMQFIASGLKVDLVPLVAIDGDSARGWMVDAAGQRANLADIPGHIAFVRELAAADPRYRPLVRIAKKWRNEAELKALGSFAIELILAHLNSLEGPAGDLESGIQRFLLYLAQTRLGEPILSGHASAPEEPGPVVILDPCDRENNVGEWISAGAQGEVAAAAEAAWEALHLAAAVGGKGETLELWREVFGSNFTTEEETT